MSEVAIVGFASSTRDLANTLPADVEIWACNQMYRSGFLKRADRWFELHSRDVYDTTLDVRRPAGYIEWLANFPGPVYMLERQPDIPSSERYPIEAIVADVGDYLTSTIAYMLALAIYEQVSAIHLYGVDMAMRSEYADQRPCCEYLLGLARGRGIKVLIPEASPLLRGPLYGRGDGRISDSQYARRLEDLRRRKRELQEQIASLTADLNMVEGALMETQFWITNTPEGMSQKTFGSTNGHMLATQLSPNGGRNG